MIFKDGEMASRQIGAAPKQKLEQWITTGGVTLDRSRDFVQDGRRKRRPLSFRPWRALRHSGGVPFCFEHLAGEIERAGDQDARQRIELEAR